MSLNFAFDEAVQIPSVPPVPLGSRQAPKGIKWSSRNSGGAYQAWLGRVAFLQERSQQVDGYMGKSSW